MNLRKQKNTPWPTVNIDEKLPPIEADGFITVFDSKAIDPRDTIVKFCDDLKDKMLAKFERGVLEHGSNWRGVDVNKEIAEEVYDIICYHAIFKAKL